MKVLKVAAIVVGVAAAVVFTAGTAIPALGAAFVAATGVGLATVSAIALGASLLSAALNAIDPAKPSAQSAIGSQTQVTLDPQAGSPYLMGRTFYAGTIVQQDTFGSNNEYIGTAFVYGGGGPYHQLEAFQVDQATVAFSGGAATTAPYNGFMWMVSQLGACPESAALADSQGTLPGWGSASKLSGYAAALLTLKFDKNGKVYSGGYPQVGAIWKGALGYDPRLDSTYPGGSGSQRSNDETTWAYSENPWIHAITWALGRHQNGKRVLGVGLAALAIVLPAMVEAANVADANGWKVGGVVSSEDDKWDVLKNICQAGSGQPIRLGGLLSCQFDTPRVSLDTVTSADLVGQGSVAGTRTRRDRFNTAIARYRSEAHGWEIVPTDPISVSSYVTIDGGTRSKELDFALVQDGTGGSATQVGQLATYQIVNAREFGPITLALKPRWQGYKPGDCLTLNIPELGLASQLAIITTRNFAPETGIVTLTLTSETASKHAFALGQTATAPPIPTLTPRNLASVAAPGAAAWSAAPATLTGSAGEQVPVIRVSGAIDNPSADAIVVEYRIHGTTPWSNGVQLSPASITYDIPALTPGSSYDVAVSYIVRGVKGTQRVLGPVTVGNGSAGINSVTVYLYQRAASTPAVPSVTATYTFATGALASINNGWSQTIPGGSNPLYVTTAIAASTGSTDTIASGEWAAPSVFAQNGANGANGANGTNGTNGSNGSNGTNGNTPAVLFMRSAAQPSTPTGSTPSGWTAGVPSGTDTVWEVVGIKDSTGTLIGSWSTPNAITSLAPRGPYASGTTYYLNNVATFGGGSYIAIQDNFSGHAPTGTDQANAYWDVVAAPGATGAPATPPSAFSATINLTSGAAVNLRTVANAAGYTGNSDATITFNVPSGVTIRGLNGAPGGIGIDTGTWPSGYTIALTLVVQSGAIVDGGGGNGGAGDSSFFGGAGSAGGAGGDAIYLRVNMSGGVIIMTGGTVRGGGGGGGGGDTGASGSPDFDTLAGGGGGGGAPNGAAGVHGTQGGGGTPPTSGSAGTTSGGGSGGTGQIEDSGSGGHGGAGGGFAAAGSTFGSLGGGAAGFAVRKNGFTATVTNSGTMTGTAA